MGNKTIFLLAAALSLSACGGGGDGDDGPQGPAPNQAPSISAIGDRTLNQDTTDTGVSFAIADAESGAAALTVRVSSSDTGLLPNENIVLGGSADARTLSLTPAEGAAGTATVTVGVTDPQGLVTRRTFQVTVNSVFASFTGFTNETVPLGEDELPRTFVGFTLDTDADEADAPFDQFLQ